MGDFLTGKLIRNEIRATYESRVYDRFLQLRHQSGQLVNIFDPWGPISTELQIGRMYELIVVTLPTSIQYFPENPPQREENVWTAKVVDPSWKALKGHYSFSCSLLYEHEWILLAASSGHLLMSPQELKTQVHTNGFVQWTNIRLDLLAVI